jgi:DNA-binding NarL/FixJ family response regulator
MASDGRAFPKRRVPPPPNLEVRRVTTDAETFLVFSWTTAPVRAASKLSHAEEDVLALIVRGCSNREISEARGVSVRTVANQIASILRKSGATSRYDLMRRHAGAANTRRR